MLNKIEENLIKRGFTPNVRNAIKNSKICIIDDGIQDLKSLIKGLKAEGFSNLVEKKKVNSVNELLQEDYDLIILDITGVAKEISAEDGIGVLSELKRHNPALQVLVVSGSSFSPELSQKLSQADLIRNKPVLPSDLSADVEELLKFRKDEYWAALSILKELRHLQPDILEKLKFFEKIKLRILQFRITKNLETFDSSIANKFIKIADIVTKLGTIGLRVVKISQGFIHP
ncbi:MAG: response regulator [Ignavibacteriaceae bacterium]|jgi:DNA-binding NtrC family response regulator